MTRALVLGGPLPMTNGLGKRIPLTVIPRSTAMWSSGPGGRDASGLADRIRVLKRAPRRSRRGHAELPAAEPSAGWRLGAVRGWAWSGREPSVHFGAREVNPTSRP